MPLCAISSKGQITLPARLRRKVGIAPHDRVLVEAEEDKIVIRPAGDLFSYEGFLGQALSPEEECQGMQRAAADHAQGQSE